MQRAGTTRWHSLITDHPDAVEVHDPYGRVIKEIHWFDTPLDDDASARDALRESVWRGMYGAQIDYLLGVFPREQVYVALFEDCVRRPLEELTRMYEFLDLDPSFRPPTLYATVNSSSRREVSQRILHPARALYEADRERLVQLLPDVNFADWS